MKRRNYRTKNKSSWKRYLLIGIILLVTVIGIKNNWFDNLLTPVFQFVASSGEEPNDEIPPEENQNNEHDPTNPGQVPEQDDEKEEPTQPEPRYLIVANKEIALADDFIPEDLTVPDVRFSQEGNPEIKQLQAAAAAALEELFAAAAEEDIILYAVSGYRSYALQESVYNRHVQNSGQEYADRISARPGHSEHQTGLSMDITSQSVSYGLKTIFGETTEGQWVARNAHRFGFIIRYPQGKEELTGYNYEPWHLRYVGTEPAQAIYENEYILEEYLEEIGL